jgi:hypothetical protein
MSDGNRDGRTSQLAQVNVALPRAPLDSPSMAGFVKGLDDVNWWADHSPGFVWRLRAVDGPVTAAALGGEKVLVTVSVWESFEDLQRYVYRSAHALFMQRRSRWFVPLGGFTTALWWVADGEQPTADEGLARLEQLRTHGPTPHAFSLRRQFDPQGAPVR